MVDAEPVDDADTSISPPCAELATYFHTEWTLDGVSTVGGCHETIPSFLELDPAGPSRPAAELILGGGQERPGVPYCGVGLFFTNTPLVTGGTGAVSDDRWAFGEGFDANVFVQLNLADSEESCQLGGSEVGVPTSGTWQVIQGGGAGDLVDVVFRDVNFARFEGHDFRYDQIRWRGRLPEAP